MTLTSQKFALAAFSAATLTLGSVLPASATQFTFSGTTGSSNPYAFPEYQNATFQGFFTIPDDAEGKPSDYSESGKKYKAEDVVIYLTNAAYPYFGTLFVDGPLAGQRGAKLIADDKSRAFVTLSSFIIDFTDFSVDNDSQDDPKRADLRLFFTDVVGSASQPPTVGPDSNTFVPSQSFLGLKQAESGAPDTTIGVESANVEVVPEPSTIAGLGAFSLFLLKRRKKAA